MILTEEEIEEIQNRPFSQNDWLWHYARAIEHAIISKLQENIQEKLKNAERYEWLVENSFDREGITQFHITEHSWEPHSQTKEPIKWVCRIRGPAIDKAIDSAMEKNNVQN